jgi:uroporphyrinogen-III synthase
MTPPRVIVTRPAREAERWVRDLGAHGWAAQALPLIAILPALDEAALRQARAGLGSQRAVMFVSGNAVRYFFGNTSPRADDTGAAPDEPHPLLNPASATRAWATGPGTVRALVDVGWPREHIDAPDVAAGEQADSEALWTHVAAQIERGESDGPDARVLVVRGGDAAGRPAGRAWLADQLIAAGAQVQTVAAYRRVPPVWDAAQRQVARAAVRDGSVWLISSSEAAANLQEIVRVALPELGLPAARAIATHPRIARAARTAGFGTVAEADGPTLEAVIRSIKSFA